MFDSAHLAWMRQTQQNHMQDIYHRMAFTAGQDAHNQETAAPVEDQTDRLFGLEMQPGSEPARDKVIELRWDATGRFPLDAEFDTRDQVKVIKRYGEVLAVPLVFDIVGPIQRGPTAVRLRLSKVLPNG